MELKACIWAHRWVIREAKPLGANRVRLSLIRNTSVTTFPGSPIGEKNKWRNAAGRQVENDDLWKELLSLRSRMPVRTDVVWTLRKQTAILKAVDRSAKAAAKSHPAATDFGVRSGKVGRSKNAVKGAATLFPASGQQTRIRVYQTVAPRGGENKIKFQVFDETRRDFCEKFVAYASPEKG